MWGRWRSWVIAAAIGGFVLAVPVAFFASLAVADRKAIAKFKENHPFALIEGKSAKEVRAAFGPPDSEMRSDDGTVELFMYHIDGSWVSCWIDFDDGRVKQMSYHGK